MTRSPERKGDLQDDRVFSSVRSAAGDGELERLMKEGQKKQVATQKFASPEVRAIVAVALDSIGRTAMMDSNPLASTASLLRLRQCEVQ